MTEDIIDLDDWLHVLLLLHFLLIGRALVIVVNFTHDIVDNITKLHASYL